MVPLIFLFKLQENLVSNTTKTKKHLPPSKKAPQKHLLHQHCVYSNTAGYHGSQGRKLFHFFMTHRYSGGTTKRKKLGTFPWGSNLRKAIKKWKQRRWAKFNRRPSVIVKVITNLLFARDKRSQTTTACLLVSLSISWAAHSGVL